MAKKIVEYEVEKYGNCWNCECLKELKQYKLSHICLAFEKEIVNSEQCQACKDFLAQEASKIDCQDCIHFWCKTSFGELEPRCAKDIEQYGEMYNWYSLNCKAKEQV
jgi:hypothetical protein